MRGEEGESDPLCEKENGVSVSRRVTQVVLRPVARPTAAQLSSYLRSF